MATKINLVEVELEELKDLSAKLQEAEMLQGIKATAAAMRRISEAATQVAEIIEHVAPGLQVPAV